MNGFSVPKETLPQAEVCYAGMHLTFTLPLIALGNHSFAHNALFVMHDKRKMQYA